MSLFSPPDATEYAPYYGTYVRLITADPLAALQTQPAELRRLLAGLTEEQAQFRYAAGKWSIKEMLVHMIDTERIFAYRALRISRGDTTALPGFEQDDYVPTSEADARPLASILHEYDTVRAATLSLLGSFSAAQLSRRGTASGQPVSVRAMSFIMAGHEAHHLHILQQRYLPLLAA
ncbi:DinB family protein [Hymenobacter psychrotolerans]|uniref:DinB superfamily protein n=1 Tax=Hymenobacter psychrotolerans DSM 18569 TaxID=1121959 RepID=A0A1M6UKU7_9BACT|nr:DinB family protein [Hymenobacter psychrotolerans]SHK69763.1 DinB superfamily protein [Hymenobacter psychrotolerans DSM 18569]